MANPVFKMVRIERDKKKRELVDAKKRLDAAVSNRDIEKERVDQIRAKIAELDAWMIANPDT